MSPHKDRAATIFGVENATLLTGTPWRYLKIQQAEFGKLQPSDFGELAAAFCLNAAMGAGLSVPSH